VRPLEKSQEMPHYMFCPRQKNNIHAGLSKSEVDWYFFVEKRDREGEKERERERLQEQDREKERE
jgi:hypothetical protein